jgi:hypothetical protein
MVSGEIVSWVEVLGNARHPAARDLPVNVSWL